MTEESFRPWDQRDLVDLLTLRELGAGRFCSRFGQGNGNGRTYGGQLMGQAMAAAAATVSPGRAPTMLQFLFLQGALAEEPVLFEVANLQDGKRFSSRHIRGSQAGGRVVCDAQATFSEAMESPEHMAPPPEAVLGTDPDACPRLTELPSSLASAVERALNYRFFDAEFIDIRFAGASAFETREGETPRLGFWIKTRRDLPEDPLLHAMALVYVSDWWINFVACLAHINSPARGGRALYVASLNHAIWLHRPARADAWNYFDCESPSAGGGRGLSFARIFDRSGRIVASATQECLIAYRDA